MVIYFYLNIKTEESKLYDFWQVLILKTYAAELVWIRVKVISNKASIILKGVDCRLPFPPCFLLLTKSEDVVPFMQERFDCISNRSTVSTRSLSSWKVELLKNKELMVLISIWVFTLLILIFNLNIETDMNEIITMINHTNISNSED